MEHSDTIVAMATPAGSGAIAVLRLSGPDAIAIASAIFFFSFGKAAFKTKIAHGAFGPYKGR